MNRQTPKSTLSFLSHQPQTKVEQDSDSEYATKWSVNYTIIIKESAKNLLLRVVSGKGKK